VKIARVRHASRPAPSDLITELRARLDESEATLRAIRNGGVDALVVAAQGGPRVFTLEGAEHSYRVLIESMNEGALMLSPGALILYANRRFSRMVGQPLSRVLGGSFHRFLSEADQEALARILKRVARPVSTIQVLLHARGNAGIPAQISVHRLVRSRSGSAAFSMVVTDMTEARRSERTLRRLSHSLLQSQETDRRLLALELHDRAAQGLGALLIRLRMLAVNLPAGSQSLHGELAAIGDLVGSTADVVESISRNLRPSVLEILGLVPALRAASAGFAKRTGIAATLVCSRAPAGLSAEAELVLYRILEEALQNVKQHAGANNVVARLRQQRGAVVLSIRDDGVGFDTDGDVPPGKGTGLIALRERAACVGGTLEIRSSAHAGTEVAARIPLLPERPTAAGAGPARRGPRRSPAARGQGRPRRSAGRGGSPAPSRSRARAGDPGSAGPPRASRPS
jgi:two-component system NarL family sensor kinase